MKAKNTRVSGMKKLNFLREKGQVSNLRNPRSVVRLREGRISTKRSEFSSRITHDYTVLSGRLTTPLSPPSIAKIYRQSAGLPARISEGSSPHSLRIS